jgi:hypothetical protein
MSVKKYYYFILPLLILFIPKINKLIIAIPINIDDLYLLIIFIYFSIKYLTLKKVTINKNYIFLIILLLYFIFSYFFNLFIYDGELIYIREFLGVGTSKFESILLISKMLILILLSIYIQRLSINFEIEKFYFIFLKFFIIPIIIVCLFQILIGGFPSAFFSNISLENGGVASMIDYFILKGGHFNHEHTGNFLGLCLIILFALYLSNKIKFFGFSFLFLLTFVLLIIVNSRGAWLSFLFSLIYFILKLKFFKNKKLLKIILSLFILSAIVIILNWDLIEYRIFGFINTIKGNDNEISTSVRILLYINYLNFIFSHPTNLIFGFGTGSQGRIVESMWFKIFLEQGIIGIILFNLFIYKIFKLTNKIIRHPLISYKIKIYSLIFPAYVFGSMFQFLFTELLITTKIGLLFFVLYALQIINYKIQISKLKGIVYEKSINS